MARRVYGTRHAFTSPACAACHASYVSYVLNIRDPVCPRTVLSRERTYSHYRSLVIPQILEDSRRVISTWGYSGSLDPFQHLPEVRPLLPRIFRPSRAAAAREPRSCASADSTRAHTAYLPDHRPLPRVRRARGRPPISYPEHRGQRGSGSICHICGYRYSGWDDPLLGGWFTSPNMAASP